MLRSQHLRPAIGASVLWSVIIFGMVVVTSPVNGQTEDSTSTTNDVESDLTTIQAAHTPSNVMATVTSVPVTTEESPTEEITTDRPAPHPILTPTTRGTPRKQNIIPWVPSSTKNKTSPPGLVLARDILPPLPPPTTVTTSTDFHTYPNRGYSYFTNYPPEDHQRSLEPPAQQKAPYPMYRLHLTESSPLLLQKRTYNTLHNMLTLPLRYAPFRRTPHRSQHHSVRTSGSNTHTHYRQPYGREQPIPFYIRYPPPPQNQDHHAHSSTRNRYRSHRHKHPGGSSHSSGSKYPKGYSSDNDYPKGNQYIQDDNSFNSESSFFGDSSFHTTFPDSESFFGGNSPFSGPDQFAEGGNYDDGSHQDSDYDKDKNPNHNYETDETDEPKQTKTKTKTRTKYSGARLRPNGRLKRKQRGHKRRPTHHNSYRRKTSRSHNPYYRSYAPGPIRPALPTTPSSRDQLSYPPQAWLARQQQALPSPSPTPTKARPDKSIFRFWSFPSRRQRYVPAQQRQHHHHPHPTSAKKARNYGRPAQNTHPTELPTWSQRHPNFDPSPWEPLRVNKFNAVPNASSSYMAAYRPATAEEVNQPSTTAEEDSAAVTAPPNEE